MTDKYSAVEIIEHLDLAPHPEGGYFKEVYRSEALIQELPNDFEGSRNISTSIYFLLRSQDKSHFHRIKSDETWHFYLGSAIQIHQIDMEGNYWSSFIGNDIMKGESLQHTVPKNVWFAAKVLEGNSFGLVGCTVSPGFDFQDFELADKESLTLLCPTKGELINEFCLT